MATKLKVVLEGLLVSNRYSCSLGRVAFWLVLGLTIYFWLARPMEEFPPSLEQVLMFLLVYNLGGKLVHNFAHKKYTPNITETPGKTDTISMGKAYDL